VRRALPASVVPMPVIATTSQGEPLVCRIRSGAALARFRRLVNIDRNLLRVDPRRSAHPVP
jgi:hypothetical protein